jgi:tyrosyl-tRNA synthetase
MTTLKSDFLKIMTERGFVHQCSDSDGLDALAQRGEIVAYVGYDCTAPSLHVGSLISIMMLAWLQKSGGKPIALMGGGTTRVGDPSGKDETRQLRTVAELSFIEFNYMLLQAYDFVELNRRYGCNVQMGGSDQWGNIVTGIDLGRRMGIKEQLFALTCPLLTTASGAKMGKTATGAVWLNEEQLSAYDYWQFWRNTEDADVERFLKLFTMLPLDEIAKLAALGGAEINEAKKRLATEATALVHGRAKAEAAAETARKTFEQGALATDLPTVDIARADLDSGLGILTAFVKAGLVASNSEARRQIQGGGLKVNDAPVTSDKSMLKLTDAESGVIKLSLGKKKHVLLKPV